MYYFEITRDSSGTWCPVAQAFILTLGTSDPHANIISQTLILLCNLILFYFGISKQVNHIIIIIKYIRRNSKNIFTNFYFFTKFYLEYNMWQIHKEIVDVNKFVGKFYEIFKISHVFLYKLFILKFLNAAYLFIFSPLILGRRFFQKWTLSNCHFNI